MIINIQDLAKKYADQIKKSPKTETVRQMLLNIDNLKSTDGNKLNDATKNNLIDKIIEILKKECSITESSNSFLLKTLKDGKKTIILNDSANVEFLKTIKKK